VKVTADHEISVGVGPFKHYGAGYAEHHSRWAPKHRHRQRLPGDHARRAVDLLVLKDARITVTNAQTGKDVWSGALSSGQ